MTTNRTFTMIKPDAVENGHIGKIIDMITGAGFEIKAMKYTRLSQKQAEDEDNPKKILEIAKFELNEFEQFKKLYEYN